MLLLLLLLFEEGLLQMFLIYFKTSSLASVFIGHNRTLITHNGRDVVANLTCLPKMGVDDLARVWLEYLFLSPGLSMPHSKLDAVSFGAVSVRQFSVHTCMCTCIAAQLRRTTQLFAPTSNSNNKNAK